MDVARLVETESAFTSADRLWRAEMMRSYGPDGVLLYGHGAERQGAPGTRLRETFEARTHAVVAWRHERRR